MGTGHGFAQSSRMMNLNHVVARNLKKLLVAIPLSLFVPWATAEPLTPVYQKLIRSRVLLDVAQPKDRLDFKDYFVTLRGAGGLRIKARIDDPVDDDPESGYDSAVFSINEPKFVHGLKMENGAMLLTKDGRLYRLQRRPDTESFQGRFLNTTYFGPGKLKQIHQMLSVNGQLLAVGEVQNSDGQLSDVFLRCNWEGECKEHEKFKLLMGDLETIHIQTVPVGTAEFKISVMRGDSKREIPFSLVHAFGLLLEPKPNDELKSILDGLLRMPAFAKYQSDPMQAAIWLRQAIIDTVRDSNGCRVWLEPTNDEAGERERASPRG